MLCEQKIDILLPVSLLTLERYYIDKEKYTTRMKNGNKNVKYFTVTLLFDKIKKNKKQ